MPRDHFTEPEALPAENVDPKALSDTWCWNRLERFPGGLMLGLISFNCFINDIEKRAHITLMNFTESTKLGRS